ncbi:MAG: helix-turn-helix domain-containing protein [Acidimicrobiales bacterium]
MVDEAIAVPERAGRTRRPRTDAARNRASLVAAAQALYAERGIDVSLEEIARSAGVGIATLYRNFPRGKEQLVSEALIDQVSHYVELARRALALPDPWEGFVTFVTGICTMQEGHAGFRDVVAIALPGDPRVEGLRRQATDLATELMDRAKAAGRLRADVVGEDLLLLLIANAAVLTVTRHDAPDASRRLVSLVVDAVATDRSPSDLPVPPTPVEMLRAMTRLASDRGCASSGAPIDQPDGVGGTRSAPVAGAR